jgi:hypothetical protein
MERVAKKVGQLSQTPLRVKDSSRMVKDWESVFFNVHTVRERNGVAEWFLL